MHEKSFTLPATVKSVTRNCFNQRYVHLKTTSTLQSGSGIHVETEDLPVEDGYLVDITFTVVEPKHGASSKQNITLPRSLFELALRYELDKEPTAEQVDRFMERIENWLFQGSCGSGGEIRKYAEYLADEWEQQDDDE